MCMTLRSIFLYFAFDIFCLVILSVRSGMNESDKSFYCSPTITDSLDADTIVTAFTLEGVY